MALGVSTCLFLRFHWHLLSGESHFGDLLYVLMLETHDGSADPSTDHASARFHRRRKAKAHKILEGKLRYVVGRDIYLDRVEAWCFRALIGGLEYVSMDKKDWFAWATEHWKAFLSYVPAISLLVQGWIVFVFLEDAHATEVLSRL